MRVLWENSSFFQLAFVWEVIEPLRIHYLGPILPSEYNAGGTAMIFWVSERPTSGPCHEGWT
jgi:hypothetical protein